jgi:hypothetical protein
MHNQREMAQTKRRVMKTFKRCGMSIVVLFLPLVASCTKVESSIRKLQQKTPLQAVNAVINEFGEPPGWKLVGPPKLIGGPTIMTATAHFIPIEAGAAKDFEACDEAFKGKDKGACRDRAWR